MLTSENSEKKKIWDKWSSGGDKIKIIFLPNELTELFYRK